jgi:hypothetical protein
MRFDEPEPLVDAARDLGQDVGRDGVGQFRCLVYIAANGPAELAEHGSERSKMRLAAARPRGRTRRGSLLRR